MINLNTLLSRRVQATLAQKLKPVSLVLTPVTTQLSTRSSAVSSSLSTRVVTTGPGIQGPWGVLGGGRPHIQNFFRPRPGLKKFPIATSSSGTTSSSFQATVRRGFSALLALIAVSTPRHRDSAECANGNGTDEEDSGNNEESNPDDDDDSYHPPAEEIASEEKITDHFPPAPKRSKRGKRPSRKVAKKQCGVGDKRTSEEVTLTPVRKKPLNPKAAARDAERAAIGVETNRDAITRSSAKRRTAQAHTDATKTNKPLSPPRIIRPSGPDADPPEVPSPAVD